jgi:hypothetical protein
VLQDDRLFAGSVAENIAGARRPPGPGTASPDEGTEAVIAYRTTTLAHAGRVVRIEPEGVG